MNIKQSDYETLLAKYSSCDGAIALLKQYRPYLETLPSTRRPEQSLITIPLPVVKIRQPQSEVKLSSSSLIATATSLPCDLGILMCDPEWKIKMGTEILIFIHRPYEDFSGLLTRWRQTQVYLDRDYEWIMPPQEEHMFSEAAEQIRPLFVLFESTLDRIKQGLAGAGLPFVIQAADSFIEENISYGSECDIAE
ncbi:MAG: hypothetical protein QNJ70_24765 [Xenococcaceae cyanobacterium MO_207.B15]|nr:hypothetical protein [Xenococcaceae cyanobacterium MO_207.B15]